MKPVLFYSPRCRYSREALELLKKLKLGDKFTCTNIDAHVGGGLPQYLDRVPMVVVNPRQRFVDKALFEFINSMNQSSIEDYDGFSAEYCYIQDADNANCVSKAFTWIDQSGGDGGGGGSDLASLARQQQQSDRNGRTKGQTDAKYESLMQSRENDLNSVFPNGRKLSDQEQQALYDKLFVPIA